MAERPTRAVTFLSTDVELNTRLWERHPETMKIAQALTLEQAAPEEAIG